MAILHARMPFKGLMDHLEQYHFWYSLILSIGMLVCLICKAIDPTAAGSLLGIIIGHYLGKSRSRSTDSARDPIATGSEVGR